ncbi:MAG: addiction module protein [Gammaproteobacteria bacterium]|nr:addiction module protein [Gammaproteobacteria bacterium]
MDSEKIEREALHLSASDRAKLAQKLLLSLDELSESELDQLWLDEAERRAREIDEGIVQLVPGDEVSRKARTLLK